MSRSPAYRIVTPRRQRAFHHAARTPFEPEEACDERALQVPGHQSGEFAVELSIVMEAVAKLPASQRAAFVLFYIEDLSVAEIAIALDVPPGTIKTRLMHARRKVRALLGEDSHEQD